MTLKTYLISALAFVFLPLCLSCFLFFSPGINVKPLFSAPSSFPAGAGVRCGLALCAAPLVSRLPHWARPPSGTPLFFEESLLCPRSQSLITCPASVSKHSRSGVEGARSPPLFPPQSRALWARPVMWSPGLGLWGTFLSRCQVPALQLRSLVWMVNYLSGPEA